MTYDEFKDYLMTHLWKMGDTVVIENLPQLIHTAETELNRIFKVEDRVTVADIQATDNIWPLPADYRTLRHCSSVLRGEMRYNLPADFANKRACGAVTSNDFTVANNMLRLIGNITVETPLDLELWYYRDLPRFADNPTGTDNWMIEDYFDVYLYCVLKHTAPFLREDDRLGTWKEMYTFAFTTAMDENDDRKFAGSPLKLKWPKGNAPVSRYR